MSFSLSLFEDSAVAEFGSLIQTRPFYTLLSGAYSLIEKIQRRLKAKGACAWVRQEIENVSMELFPYISTNRIPTELAPFTLLLNSRWIPPLEWNLPAYQPHCGVAKGCPVYYFVPSDQFPVRGNSLLISTWANELNLPKEEVAGDVLKFPWDLVQLNGKEICADAKHYAKKDLTQVACTVIGDSRELFISPTASLEPMVILDCSMGPILIGPAVQIKAFSRIEGPCFIGEGTQILGGKIRGGTSIGKHCRIGGEIENSILHGFTNKYHEGFLGHSVIGEWVNFGAGTNNSDLRIDYKTVKVQMAKALIDSGFLKIGCYVGDHTKTAIGVQINTGAHIGSFCTLLPGGLSPRYLSSFSCFNGSEIHLRENLDEIMKSVEIAMARRNVAFSPALKESYFHLYESSLKGWKSSSQEKISLRRRSA